MAANRTFGLCVVGVDGDAFRGTPIASLRSSWLFSLRTFPLEMLNPQQLRVRVVIATLAA